MRAIVFLLVSCLWLLQTANASLFSSGGLQDDFLPVDQAFELHIEPQDEGGTLVRWDIAPGYYLYQERLSFGGLDADFQPSLPPGEPYTDEFFGDSQIFRGSLEVLIPQTAVRSIKLGWQGCADAGLCYPPQSKQLTMEGAGPSIASGSLVTKPWSAACSNRRCG
mgnify:FL=1